MSRLKRRAEKNEGGGNVNLRRIMAGALALLAVILIYQGIGRVLEAREYARNVNEIEELVKKYPDRLSMAYGESELEGLKEVASPLHVDKVKRLVGWNLENKGQKIEARAEKQKIGPVKLGENRASVAANETWSYVYVNHRSGKVTDSFSGKYQSRYELKKDAAGWVVENVVSKKL